MPQKPLLPCPCCGSLPFGPAKQGPTDERNGYNFRMHIMCPCGLNASAESTHDSLGWCTDSGQAAKKVTAIWNTRTPKVSAP